MPVLKNARHELFCQALSQGMTQDAAYKAAGYQPNRFNAHRLNTNEHIRTRVAELQGRNIAKQDEIAAVSLASLVSEAEAARTKAMAEKGGAAAAVTALTAKAKLAGLWIERSERKSLGGDLNSLSDAELAAIVREGLPTVEAQPRPKADANSKLN